MNGPDWLKQSKDKPLFGDLLWSRPETKSRAGKLLIIGGSAHGFNAPALAYNQAVEAQIGSQKVLLPDSLKSTLGKFIEDAVYCPSNISGSFARESLAEFLDHASWADMSLLAGDFGHNSETAILLESFIHDYKGLLSLVGDSLGSLLTNPLAIFDRAETLIVTDLAMLQKLASKAHTTKALTSSLSLIQIVDTLSELSKDHQAGIITSHLSNFIVAINGKVSTTAYEGSLDDWELKLATYSSVWLLQNRSRAFEALTTAVYDSLYPTVP